MLIAVNKGFNGLIPVLIEAKANPNIANTAGETPLIRAVQNRDLATIRILLADGADPDQADIIAGMSARDYAARDSRNPAVAKIMAETPRKAARPAVAGPKL
jgi:ankyrin repeat protein